MLTLPKLNTLGQPVQGAQPVLRRLFLVETGTYDDQYHRPYVFNPSQGDVNEFQEVTYGDTRVTPTGIAAVAGRMIKPRAMAGHAIGIAGGWGNRRLRFLMIVEFPVGLGNSQLEVITGYTDHVGVSMHGRAPVLDPHMRFYINNTVSIRVTNQQFGGGQVQPCYTVIEAAHLIVPVVNAAGNLMTTHQSPTTHLMRPQDVLGAWQATTLPGDTVDTRNQMLGNTVKMSRRSNGLAPEYLTRITNAIVGSETTVAETIGLKRDEVYTATRARDDVREPMAARDQFLRFINNGANSEFQWERNVTYGSLRGMFPNIDADEITSFTPRNSVVRNDFAAPERGMTESLGGAGPLQSIAVQLANMLPAIMMDLMLAEVNMEISNQTLDGVPFVKIGENASRCFVPVDSTPYATLFAQRVVKEVFPALTDGNNIALHGFIYVDILGTTHMRISYAGSHITDFMVPTFCDGLFAPTVTDQGSNLTSMATQIHDLATPLINRHVELLTGATKPQPSTFVGLHNHGTNAATPSLILPTHHGRTGLSV